MERTNWLTAAPLSEWFGVTTDREGRVTALNLPGNALSGPIPDALGDLTFLEVLDLAERWDPTSEQWIKNALTGPIPLSLGNLARLKWLALTGNQLSGAIPTELGNLPHLSSRMLPASEGCISTTTG